MAFLNLSRNWVGQISGNRETKVKGIEFRETKVKGIEFSECKVNGIEFCKAKVKGIEFRETKVKGIEFCKAKVKGIEFSESKVNGIEFCKAKVKGIEFRETKVKGIEFRKAKVKGIEFSESKENGIEFCKAKVKGIEFRETKVKGIEFCKAKVKGIEFSESKVNGIEFCKANVKGIGFSIEQNPGAPTKKQTTLTAPVHSGERESMDGELKMLILNMATEIKSLGERIDIRLTKIETRMDDWDKRFCNIEEKLTKCIESQQATEKLASCNSLKNDPILDSEITNADIYKEIAGLRSNKACGPDGIPNEVLKTLPDSYILLLKQLYNSVMTTGKYPAIWTNSTIRPIFKNGYKNSPSNYREFGDIHLLLYADDIAIIGESRMNLQKKIKILKEYLDENLMTLNESKSKIMVFRNGGQAMAAALQKIDIDPEQQLYTSKLVDIAAPVIEMYGDI
ncbi:hypothetical protein LAZ67_8002280 [Cordylochernes scorpioides]|uniref:Reverse transcriptase domain-containing protein n=1 Tax=Cordylochernes scorpioides TaxID=51811 RepID=A0ABY6KQU0_9ARAC|nr:hypothetical protein LAZ67_8002280 [Cordylochernes scorpioides]